MKVWISKYALTTGLFEMEVHHMSEDGDSVYGNDMLQAFHKEGKDWHKTKEEAILRAEELRKKKIESLQKQLKKLEKMTF